MTHSATKGRYLTEALSNEVRALFHLALLGLLASVAMAMDNNWPAAALGCVAAGGLFVMAIV
jgi:hypothetical protein